MPTFSTSQKAKEYLVSQIIGEARREGIPLSEVERKMMYFTETGWSLPDIQEVNEVFERDYDTTVYENKIGTIARNALAHGRQDDRSYSDTWDEAVQMLEREGHYLLVLLSARSDLKSADSLLVDRLKLLATGILATLVLLAAIFFINK